jgi:hypothetical protein
MREGDERGKGVGCTGSLAAGLKRVSSKANFHLTGFSPDFRSNHKLTVVHKYS